MKQKNEMHLTLIISDNCNACDRAKIVIERLSRNYPHLFIETIDVNSYEGRKISITPALLIDQELFSYGDIDETKLYKKLS